MASASRPASESASPRRKIGNGVAGSTLSGLVSTTLRSPSMAPGRSPCRHFTTAR